jgi:ankyrin repeat protein
MCLLRLPNELLLLLATFLEAERDINSLCQTNSQLHTLLNPCLYQHNSINHGSFALQWAAKHGNQATAQISIQEGARLSMTDRFGRTPLSWEWAWGSGEVIT